MQHLTNSSMEGFEQLLNRQQCRSFEHLLYADHYLENPVFLVILYLDGIEHRVYGLDYADPLVLKTHLLNRATELLQCSCVHPSLCRVACLLRGEDGYCWFHYDEENYCYKITK